MNPAFESLTALAPDALLGLMTAYREDKRAEKFDLGVGVYKDDAGHTPVMSAVAKAEAIILTQQTTKVYEGPRGNPDFCAAIERFVFGDSSHLIEKGRLVSLATPGGCGALYLGVGLMKRLGVKTVWVSRPTWPNHPALIKNTGLAVAEYDYADPETGKVDFEGLMASLSQTKRGDGIIIQGPCHNPTGIDLSVKQWIDLAMLTVERGIIPMLDIAYHGFASGLDADMEGARLFLQIAEELDGLLFLLEEFRSLSRARRLFPRSGIHRSGRSGRDDPCRRHFPHQLFHAARPWSGHCGNDPWQPRTSRRVGSRTD